MTRRFAVPALLAALLALAVPAPAAAATVPLPNSMAAAGDSITRAFDVTWWGCIFTDCPQYSWATGTNATVNSQYSRILAQNPAIRGYNYNVARTGAKMADLDGQLVTAAGYHVDYLTILMGANDVCTSDVSTMTSTTDFQAQLTKALTDFFAADPGAHVYVSSLPNIAQLYNVESTNRSALNAWSAYNICQSALPPHGTAASRQAVTDRENAFDAILQSTCANTTWAASCRYDGGAGFAFNFPASDLSTIDYFHPNVYGQRDVAALTWSKSYWAV